VKYLLDTNILSELARKRPNPYLMERLHSKKSQWLFTSCVCAMELRFGSALREDSEIFWRRIADEILSKVSILPLNLNEVLIAGDILASLKKSGQTIGLEDVLIASTALSHKCTMVSANTRHFSKVEGLVLENWLEPAGL
jgi:tRNA(fMet)-specific endonuclease VapC